MALGHRAQLCTQLTVSTIVMTLLLLYELDMPADVWCRGLWLFADMRFSRLLSAGVCCASSDNVVTQTCPFLTSRAPHLPFRTGIRHTDS